jgi:hypothetical protein
MQDNGELEKEIEEAFAIREGEELLDEERKQMGMKKYRFRLMTRMFFVDPEEKNKPKKKKKEVGIVHQSNEQ